MTTEKKIRMGVVAAKALRIICDDPENAYAHAITKRINEERGATFTHNLEVGEALKLLVEDGALVALGPTKSPKSNRPRHMFLPTWKAGFYLGLTK